MQNSFVATEPETRAADFTGRWWVLHTRSRAEKVVSGHLTRSGIQHFLPLVTLRRRYGGRDSHVCVPLFPGYVFLCGEDRDRIEALRCNRIAHVLEVSDQDRLRSDLLQIELLVTGDEPIDLYPRIRVGSMCRVVSGHLAGLEGVVLRRRGPWRVFVGVQFVGQSAELEIDSSLVEVLD